MRAVINFLLALCVIAMPVVGDSQTAKMSGGLAHTLYLCPQGSVFSWGDNTYGQLGRKTVEDRDVLSVQIDKLDNIIDISAGLGDFSLALRSDGTVWAWGLNQAGQLGNNVFCKDAAISKSCEKTHTPVCVLGGVTGSAYLSGVRAVSAGYNQAYALLHTGKVLAWGENNQNQLGNFANMASATPVFVLKSDSTPLAGVVAVAAGAFSGYALTSDGKVWGWGKNTAYELGNASDKNQRYATAVLSPDGTQLSGIKKIDAGLKYALFLSNDLRVYGTGACLGTAFTGDSVYYTVENKARLIPGGATGEKFLNNISDISAGFTHAIARRSIDGKHTAYSWGDNKYLSLADATQGGQLGVGDKRITHSQIPVAMVNSFGQQVGNVVTVVATGGNSFVVTQNPSTNVREIHGAGANDMGQLGIRNYEQQACLSKIITPSCQKGCPMAYFGDDKQLCFPIADTLSPTTIYNGFNFTWFINDSVVNNHDKHFLPINRPARYAVLVSDRDTTRSCQASGDEVVITGKTPDFNVINPDYCGDTLRYNILGNSEFRWFNNRMADRLLGTGNYVTVTASQLAGDNVKTIWLFTPQCQPMPVSTVKNCSTCLLPTPLVAADIGSCQDSALHITSSVQALWYDSTHTRVVGMGSLFTPATTNEGRFRYYVCLYDNHCESKAIPVDVTVVSCVEKFVVTGRIIPPQPALVTIYDFYDNTKVLKQLDVSFDGLMSFNLHRSRVKIEVEPYFKSLYATTYFGNTLSMEWSHFVDIDANISGIDITMRSLTGLDYPVDVLPIVYPCFASHSVTVRNPGAGSRIAIVNSVGQLMMEYVACQDNDCQFDVSMLCPGLYTVMVQGRNGGERGRFMKH